MAGETISFTELFEQQDAAAAGLRVTAQPVPDDPDRVKITPVDGDGACWCASALVIPVGSVASLRSTDDMAVCCGKRLKVVEIEFADEALAAVVGQVHARAATASSPGRPVGPGWPQAFGPPGMAKPGPSYLPNALAAASLFSLPDKTKTSFGWPDISCLAEYYACLVLCGGYEGCAQVCADAYSRCTG